ncbi:MAG: hypothetical protein WC683_02700 [bacterium]
MIRVDSKKFKRLDEVPKLPRLTRQDFDTLLKNYPPEAEVPIACWRVTLQCGDYGGSFGFYLNLGTAILNAAREGWSPVHAFNVKVGWDKFWSPDWDGWRFIHSEPVIKVMRGYPGGWAQQVIDTVLAAAKAGTIPALL